MITMKAKKNVQRALVKACLKEGIDNADMMVSLVREINKSAVSAHKAWKTIRSR